jgi:hypothetical protein
MLTFSRLSYESHGNYQATKSKNRSTTSLQLSGTSHLMEQTALTEYKMTGSSMRKKGTNNNSGQKEETARTMERPQKRHRKRLLFKHAYVQYTEG